MVRESCPGEGLGRANHVVCRDQHCKTWMAGLRPMGVKLAGEHRPSICVMAGPSGRAFGPPKGMLGPATHD
jgi:hypothetical protein